MEQKKLNSVIIGLIVLAITISIFGIVLLTGVLSNNNLDEQDFSRENADVVSLNANEESQEYASSGVISLNIVNNDLENELEE